MTISKESLRSQIKKIRSEFSESDRLRAEQRILDFLKEDFSRDFLDRPWLLYSPIHQEVPTQKIFEWLKQNKTGTYFPKVVGGDLTFYKIADLQELIPGSYGLEPSGKSSELESYSRGIALIPGIAFSRDGHRIGFGKGYYDRFLERNPHLIRIGLAYDSQMIAKPWSSDPHDQQMHGIFCPSSRWALRGELSHLRKSC